MGVLQHYLFHSPMGENRELEYPNPWLYYSPWLAVAAMAKFCRAESALLPKCYIIMVNLDWLTICSILQDEICFLSVLNLKGMKKLFKMYHCRVKQEKVLIGLLLDNPGLRQTKLYLYFSGDKQTSFGRL